jgi:hypothetical protein
VFSGGCKCGLTPNGGSPRSVGACATVLLIRCLVPSALHMGHCSLLGVNVAVPGDSCKVGLQRGLGLCPIQLHLLSYPLHHYPAHVGIQLYVGIVLSFPVYGLL